MTTVGFLYPGHFAEDDFPRMEILLDAVRLVVNRTEVDDDAYRIDALIRTGAPEHLAAGVEELQRAGVEAVVWASGAGSFLYGWEGAHEQTAALARAAGVPASSTSFGFAHAVRELGADRVAVASTYPERITALFAEFLHAAGLGVAVTRAAGLESAAEAAAWDLDRVKELAVAADRPEADVVLLPDTALHTAGHEAELEEAPRQTGPHRQPGHRPRGPPPGPPPRVVPEPGQALRRTGGAPGPGRRLGRGPGTRTQREAGPARRRTGIRRTGITGDNLLLGA